MEKYRSNVIYLKKGAWLTNEECEFRDDYNCLPDWKTLQIRTDLFIVEPFVEKLKVLRIGRARKVYGAPSPKEVKANDYRTLEKFKRLEHLELSVDEKITIDIPMFKFLKNLTYFQLTLPHLNFKELQLHKFMPKLQVLLFKDMTKLVELKLELFEVEELNKNHFVGLEKLQTLKLNGDKYSNKKVVLNQCLDSLVNLKYLELEKVVLNQFSLLPFEKVETLKLNDYLIKLKGPYRVVNLSNNNDKRFFRNLKNLKYLELSQNCKKYIPYTIPSTVETFKTSQSYFESMNLKSNGVPFIYEIKHLGICHSQNLEKFNLFEEDCVEKFQNLESLQFSGVSYLTTTQLKSLKNLYSLTLDRVELMGIDVEFNYLREASFTSKIPENIVNFYNLEKLCLEHIYPSIPINETFLENLISLEELKLTSAFDSIDENARYLFKNLTKLKKLTMKCNNIKAIKSSYLDYLVNLEEIDLSINPHLKIIEFGSFKNLSKLKSLDLWGCVIKEIKKDTFLFNSKLEKVIFQDKS